MIAAIYAVMMLAAMLVLLTPWSAWAECAWVLWSSVFDLHTSSTEWQPQRATDELSRCTDTLTAAVTEHAATLRDRVPKFVERYEITMENTLIITLAAKDHLGVNKTLIVRYLCFPDTVDPRGPKGSDR
jgi:hypothetical protein